MRAGQLDFLDDPERFKALRGRLRSMQRAERDALLASLEASMRSSAWATKDLFKPGIRNFWLQERLGGRGTVKQYEHFLGDQEYLFKFFFQNAFASGKVPGAMDLLRQAINIPSFRFRLESIDMLVELDGAVALPALFNLVSGLEAREVGSKDLLARIEANLDALGEASTASPKLAGVFTRLRLLLVERSS
ncbi:MAG: hypothetical protein JW839_17115 [Candidatus Lokiarchaeota archaeon]|nr:hypothetical protein [Candidatus Lokiarchaeota archaeon]